jgi:hypothetical protein
LLKFFFNIAEFVSPINKCEGSPEKQMQFGLESLDCKETLWLGAFWQSRTSEETALVFSREQLIRGVCRQVAPFAFNLELH